MRMRTAILLFALTLTSILYAQTDEKKVALGLHFGLNEYHGDLGNGFFNFNNLKIVKGAASLSLYLNPSFNIGMQGSYGDYGFISSKPGYLNQEFDGQKWDGSLFVEYKLNNGYILPTTSLVAPFISAGMGFANYTGEANKINVFPTDFIAPVGAGLKFQFTQSFAVQYKYQYNFTNNDNHDMVIDNRYNDRYGQHLLGLVFSFGKKKQLPPIIQIEPEIVVVEEPVIIEELPEEVTEMISLLEQIQFEFDSQVIKPESFPLLDHAFKVLAANPEYKLLVEGHTDNIGTEAYNLDLSMRRARAVFYYLTLKGIDEDRVIYKGYGSSRPKATNSTAEGRAQNRRVEYTAFK